MMGFTWVYLWTFCYKGKLSQPSTNKIYSFKWALLVISLLVNSNFIFAIHDAGIAKEYKAEFDTNLQMTQEQKSEGKENILLRLTELDPKILYKSRLRPWKNNAPNKQYGSYLGVNNVYALPRPILEDPEATARWLDGDTSDFEKLAEGKEYLSFLLGELYDVQKATYPGMDNVPKDESKAIYWYTKAAELGNLQARRRLTRAYVVFDNSPGRYLKALMWFIRSELPLLLP